MRCAKKGYYYKVNGEERRYVNARKYYIKAKPLEGIGGEIKVGDYVNYIPDSGEYTENETPLGKEGRDYYLGYHYDSTIQTDRTIKWRVVKINEGTGEVLITSENAVNSLCFYEGPGYLNSVRLLDYVCGKLYSNSLLGIKARSMRIEVLYAILGL